MTEPSPPSPPGPSGAARQRVTREMGVTHADFFRTLPALLDGYRWHREGDTVHAERNGRRLTICIGSQRERRIALLAIPVTDVAIEFNHWPPAAVDAFMAHYEVRFRRGGG